MKTGFLSGIILALLLVTAMPTAFAGAQPPAPTVVTSDATNITTNSARLSGNVTDLGTSSSANISFIWGTTSGNLTNETPVQSVNITGPYFSDLGSLSDNTTYYFQAKAVGNGTGLGVEKSFTTLTTTVTLTVTIDIKPGSYPNSINPDSQGVIPVAIMSTAGFDATTVDPATIRFGPAEAAAVHSALEDLNDDGLLDMILQFRTQDTGLGDGDTQATLTGQTTTGTYITGTDSVRIVPGAGKGKAVGKATAPGQVKEPGTPAIGKAIGKQNAPGQNSASGTAAGNGGGKQNAPGQNKSPGQSAVGKGKNK